MKKILTWLTVFICVNHLYAQTGSRGVNVTHTKDTSVFDGNIYAVIVGVSNYKYVRPLSFADRDALLFKEFLQSGAGGNVKEDNIFFKLNDSANVSTLPRMEEFLKETKKLQKGDRVYFYFAGHGDAIDPDEVFFLLQDCNPGGDINNYPMASAIQMSNIKALIKNFLINKGVEVFLIWDACRSNELGGESGLRNMQKGIVEKTDGESIMLSASAGEVSLENSSYANGHGLFTYYLIDGLSGAADNPANDGNGDGKVDMRELESWVTRKVRVDAQTKFKISQDPRFIYNGDETLSIIDSGFENEWTLDKKSESDLALNYNKTTKVSGRNVQEADSMVVELYNEFMAAVKIDSLDGVQNSAEELYKQLLNKYPDNSLTGQAGFNLAMEYINLAQDKINLYLSGQDDLTILATSKVKNEDHEDLNKAQIISSGKNYGKNAQYLNRAITLLKKDTLADLEYIKQLQAKADFLMSRSYVSNEGIVTNFSKALQLAKAALSVQPKAAYNYLLFGSLFYINRQYDSSIYYVRHALALAPNWVNAINNLGLAFDAEKKSDSARFYYRKAIAINPDFLIPYANLSYSFSSQNNYDSAYKYVRKAVDLNPLYAGGINTLGIIFHFQKMYDSAKVYYYKAISIDPKDVHAYDNLGILFYNEKMYDSSKAYYLKAISVNPEYTDGYYDLALVFESQKQFDSAKEYYYKTLSINPKYSDAFNGIGYIFLNDLKKPDSAKAYFNKTISIDPESTYAFYNLGVLFYKQNQYDSARIYYCKALSIDPNYTYAYNELANIFTIGKQFDSARIYYGKAIEMDSKFTEAYYNLGVLFYNQNKFDSAREYYNKAIAIDADYANAYNGIGNIFFKQKEYDSAMMYYRTVIPLDSLNLNAYNLLSACLGIKVQIDSSAYVLKQIIKHKIADSSTFRIGIIISNYYQEQKSFDKEIDITQLLYNYDSAYHIAGVDSSQKANLLNNLAYAYVFNGQADQSKYYYTKAGFLDYYYYNMACMKSLDKKTKEALENLELSFKNGFNDFDHIQEDTDLDNIRNTDEFKQLLKKYFPGKAK
ncbi:MAG TPA: tetratricopeptide repeat protein [Hanamia sp.]